MKGIAKKFTDGVVVGLGIVLVVGVANAWTGLQAESGDTLTHTKWNELVDKVDGIFTDGSGNVGIGTETPLNKLHLEKDGYTRISLLDTDTYHYSIGTTGNDFTIRDESNSADRLRISGNGNLGIGTTNPRSKFTIIQNGTTKDDGIEVDGTGLDSFRMYLDENKVANLERASQKGNGLSITHDGRVGIGTTTVGAKLEIKGFSGNGGDNILLTTGETGDNKNKYLFDARSDSDILSITARTDVNGYKNKIMSLHSDGNVGIGNDNPVGKLDVKGGESRFETARIMKPGVGNCRLEVKNICSVGETSLHSNAGINLCAFCYSE